MDDDAPLLLAIDQGTTGTTALVIDDTLRVRARHNVEFAQIYPKPGWVEHDADAIWASVERAVLSAVRETGRAPSAIGITNQRETALVWERDSGRPIHNAIVWQDRRTAPVIERLKEDGAEALVSERTGLLLDPYFSAAKFAWILDRVPGARARAERGELCCGTVDTYLLWRLSGAHSYKTDVSNASRTSLMDLERCEWDEELLALFGVPHAALAAIVDNAGDLGQTRGAPGLPDGTPIAGMAGDQQAALFGQACFEPGQAKCTYGTGAFLLMNTGSEPARSSHRLLSTAAWRIGAEMTYALEGSAFIAGALIQWLRDGLGIIESAAEIEALARSVEDAGGVTIVPSFAGLGAPHWRPKARGLIAGLTRGSGRAEIARAALEAIALQNVEILEAMRSDALRPIETLRVDGGASANDLLMQIQSDLLGTRLERPAMTDTTALGSALMAGLATGVFKDRDAIARAWKADRSFEPSIKESERAQRLASWRETVAKA